MPRRARLVLPGHPHHVIQRGSRRRRVFMNEDDYDAYRRLLAEKCSDFSVDVVSYCLMPNHVHAMVVPETPEALSCAFGQAHKEYAWRINRREKWSGHLWQARFHSFAMDDAHCRACLTYIIDNPVRAHLVRDPLDWPHSSARVHLEGVEDWLIAHDRLRRWGLDRGGSPCDEEQLRAFRESIASGRPLGGAAFLREAELVAGRSLEVRKPGRPRRRQDGPDE